MNRGIHRLLSDESGQALGEYALIIALLSLGLVVILSLFRNAIGAVLAAMAESLSNN